MEETYRPNSFVNANLERAEASVQAINRLNPRVRVTHDSSHIASKDKSFFEGFDVIIVTDLPLSTMVRLLIDMSLIVDITERIHTLA